MSITLGFLWNQAHYKTNEQLKWVQENKARSQTLDVS